MNPETAPQTEAGATTPAASSLERLFQNRPLIYGCLGLIAVIFVAYIAVYAMNQSKVKAANKAWGAFHEGMARLNVFATENGTIFPPGTPEFFQATDPAKQIEVFSDILQRVEGSQAEAVTLFYLANAYLCDRKIDEAERTLKRLQSDFPNHYLVNADKSYMKRSLVQDCMQVVEREREFLNDNPQFGKGIKPEGESGDDATSSEEVGATPDDE